MVSPLADEIVAATEKTRMARTTRDRALARRELIRVLTVALVFRDGSACRYCGVQTDTGGGHRRYRRTFDHIRPVSAGGEDTLDNGVIACQACNSRKSDRPVQAFARMVSR